MRPWQTPRLPRVAHDRGRVPAALATSLWRVSARVACRRAPTIWVNRRGLMRRRACMPVCLSAFVVCLQLPERVPATEPEEMKLAGIRKSRNRPDHHEKDKKYKEIVDNVGIGVGVAQKHAADKLLEYVNDNKVELLEEGGSHQSRLLCKVADYIADCKRIKVCLKLVVVVSKSPPCSRPPAACFCRLCRLCMTPNSQCNRVLAGERPKDEERHPPASNDEGLQHSTGLWPHRRRRPANNDASLWL